MKKDYDVIVIGTGAAGTTFAYKLNAAGMTVAIVDCREYGGTCALRGCIPKKVLTGVANIIDAHNRMLGKGTGQEKHVIDWPSLIAFKKTFTDPHPPQTEQGFKEANISIYHGIASFEDESTLIIGDEKIRAKYIIITTGSRPRKLNIPGEEYLVTSEAFMELEELPKKIIFAGGGYISFEFAHIAARAGSDVTILQRGDKVLKEFDSDLVDILVKASEDAGIRVIKGKEVKKIEKTRDGFKVTTCCQNEGKDETFFADMVVHGSGRVPAIEELQLEKGNVALDNGNIALNEYFQSISNPGVYAAGDCIRPGPPLTPVASLQAAIAANNIIEGNKYTVDYTVIPSTVFTIPPLAGVGITENISTENISSKKHKVLFYDMSQWYSTRRTNLKYAASKVIIDEATDKILGAHILGPDAEEVINLFAVAMKYGLTATQLRSTVFSYPSIAYDLNYILK
ncbi:Dihydrolipoyl dehydrogenase [Methanosarcina lacustris Z-7289]|uniref:Dihydrolipoyl dehydrogenase n=1 Tax=Methanosarcina lacustris Z-7289 TaxID=1434111 RepID=A0A0E3S8N5_9EURY|nr:NAD(P)/FAD-dependent oxidoreductase [Methanosarcina lacustris]AKB75483.1 Dihydrolipoyl dehydrogenase [Methanosarcina lacustris Z-7289]